MQIPDYVAPAMLTLVIGMQTWMLKRIYELKLSEPRIDERLKTMDKTLECVQHNIQALDTRVGNELDGIRRIEEALRHARVE